MKMYGTLGSRESIRYVLLNVQNLLCSRNLTTFVPLVIFFVAIFGKLNKYSSMHMAPSKSIPLSSNDFTIMAATTFYRDDMISGDPMKDCPYNCRVVSIKTMPEELLSADILIFHMVFSDFKPIWFDRLSKMRKPHQLFMFYSMEPPPVLSAMLPRRYYDYTFMNNKFNLTSTYSLISDFPVPYGYGYEPKPFFNKNKTEILPIKSNWVSIKGKKAMVALISNCAATNYRRLDIVKELQSHGLDVDVYGKCGTMSCPGRAGDECYKQLEKKYLFYGAFENSICEDYVTEKFFKLLNFDIVPIVIGGANYSRYAPPNSFIRMHDFSSLISFVRFVTNLSNDEAAYNKYFEWRQHYRKINIKLNPYCGMCEMLHKMNNDSQHKNKVYRNFEYWWTSQCKKYDTLETIFSGKL